MSEHNLLPDEACINTTYPPGLSRGRAGKTSHLCLFLQGVYLHILQALPEDLTSNFSTHLGPECDPPQRTKKMWTFSSPYPSGSL